MSPIVQINLHDGMGGGEIYTRFFSQALIELGHETVLFVARGQRYWKDLRLAGVRIVEVLSEKGILSALPAQPALIVTHTPASAEFSRAVAPRHRLTGFAHMPLYERDPRVFSDYATVFAVSRHVLDSAHARGLDNLHPEPLYGVADLGARSRPEDGESMIRAASVYDWDRRKMRDRLLGWVEPAVRVLRRPQAFSKRPGITLGIVSRLTPIKQFPLMFSILAPVLARHPGVNLEIFGSGGYASVRDLRRALAPVRSRVRFWGHQGEIARVYDQLDFVLSGLPEKEALGLNLIEAQSRGIPVLAVNAPPFTETVVDGAGGYLFEDPRHDGGNDFGRRLGSLGKARIDPRENQAFLARFSREAFRNRVRVALEGVMHGR